MNPLKYLLAAACSTAILAPASSSAAEKNAAGFLSYASHDELVKAAKQKRIFESWKFPVGKK